LSGFWRLGRRIGVTGTGATPGIGATLALEQHRRRRHGPDFLRAWRVSVGIIGVEDRTTFILFQRLELLLFDIAVSTDNTMV
jgi:hypothetical protein